MKSILIIIFTSIIIFCSCKSEKNIKPISAEYKKEIEDWHKKRIENLKKETGWLNLVGLFWLQDGENSFGSGENNKIIFPKNSPTEIGKFIKNDSKILFESNPNVNVFSDGKKVDKIVMKIDLSGNPTILESGSLKWFIIKRDEKYGIRLRDLNSDLVKNFSGIERFPIDENWKITAKFIPYEKPKEVEIPTIIGTIEKEISPGKLNLKIDEKEYFLEPTSAGEKLFLVFADLTSGEETYGAGRFLVVEKPDSNNNVIIDFNKSYIPPCAFTKFATCPLPTDENKLRVKITAGEKNFGEEH
ncbi:MAG: DUF1684 domain-containing protein [Ignavibacteriae bacterium]|nr:DUF1684 domain-containing protein [Ignavibacteriota bacterium]